MDESVVERWREISAADGSPATEFELLRRLVQDFPEFGAGWSQLGKVLGELSQFDEAEHALQRAIEWAPPEHVFYVFGRMGALFNYQGKDELAEHWYRRAIDHSPEHTYGYIMLGAMFARRGRLAEAEQVHRRGTLCKAGSVDEAYYNLGLILRARGQYEEAVACFESALKIDPRYKIARSARRDVRRAIHVRAKTLAPEHSPTGRVRPLGSEG